MRKKRFITDENVNNGMAVKKKAAKKKAAKKK